MSETSNVERPTRLSVPVELARDHSIGSRTAPVILLEYGDYECPDCHNAHPIVRRLCERFGDELLFVFRHFPQYSIHRHASVAAQGAEASGSQGKFWEMHDLLYDNPPLDGPHDLSRYAMKLSLDVYRFESDISSERFRRRVEADYASGEQSGVRGTPTMFVNEIRYAGPVEFDELAAAIEAARRVATS